MCEHAQHAFPCDLLTCTGQGNTLRLLVTGERNSMGDALACGRLRGMCTPA